MNKDPIFTYDPIKKEWKTEYITSLKSLNNKNNPPYKNNKFKQSKSSNQYKSTKPSKPANNIKDLQEQVKYWSQTAQNHLLNLSKTSAELFTAEEIIKKLKEQGINKELEKALIEANQKIRRLQEQEKNWKEAINKSNTLISDKDQKIAQHEETIKELQRENKEQYKIMEQLKKQTKIRTTIKERLKKA